VLQVIENEEASLQALQRHMREMNATLEALETLPDKIYHDVMVPFGNVAMFPGWHPHLRSIYRSLLDAGVEHDVWLHGMQES
jgi:hypothetical protein